MSCVAHDRLSPPAVAFSATTLRAASLQDRFRRPQPSGDSSSLYLSRRLGRLAQVNDRFSDGAVSRMPSQLEERVSNFHLNQFVVHNTYC